MLRTLLFSILCLITLPAFAQTAQVASQIERSLNGIKTAQARFTQIAPDGSQATGTFYLKRPGRLRFEYDPPSTDFVVADGYLLYYYDGQQKNTTNAPIGTTLADFLLRKNISLSGDLSVTDVRDSRGVLQVTVVQSADPNAGKLVLGVDKDTYMLRKWQVYDPTGNVTQVDLSDMKTGVTIDPAKFVYRDPNPRKNGKR